MSLANQLLIIVQNGITPRKYNILFPYYRIRINMRSALIILLLSVVAPSVEIGSNSTCRNVVYNIQKVESMHQVCLQSLTQNKCTSAQAGIFCGRL